MAPTLLIILGLTALVIGLLGTIYPALPGLILMFVGAWLLGYADDYATIGSGTLIAIGIFTAVGTATDFVAGMLGAKFTGASKEAVWGSFSAALPVLFSAFPACCSAPCSVPQSENSSPAKMPGWQEKSASEPLSASSWAWWRKSAVPSPSS